MYGCLLPAVAAVPGKHSFCVQGTSLYLKFDSGGLDRMTVKLFKDDSEPSEGARDRKSLVTVSQTYDTMF